MSASGDRFDDLLRRFRFAACLTQEELAHRSGLSVRTLSDMERGRTARPLISSVRLLADALDLDMSARTRLTAAVYGETSDPRAEQQASETAGTEGMPEGAAPASSAGLMRFESVYQLPPDISDFTGRRTEYGKLVELLVTVAGATAVPVAVVSGPPGVGKTSLALHVAHSLRGRFPDGQLYVQLAGVSTSPRMPGEVLGELLRTVGVDAGSIPRQTAARSAMLRSRLADRRVLLVADDAASVAQVRMLVPGTAGSAVLVTSRDLLTGLSAAHVHLDSLQPGEAVEMLGRIAGKERVAADPAAAKGLVAACGHLPLAVRIAGARLAARPSWPVAMLASLVSDERQRLDELTVGDLDIRAAMELSYQALPPQARKAFRLLALTGPFDFSGWTVTTLAGPAEAPDVVDLLVDKCMLGAGEVDATGQPRYRLHDLLRAYAAERLARQSPHERAASLERLLGAWLQLSERADQAMPSDPYLPPAPGHLCQPVLPQPIVAELTASPVGWFSTERLNLRHATSLACANGRPDLGLQLALRQAAFHHAEARFDEAEQLWRMVRNAARRAGDAVIAAHAAFGVAVIRALQGYHAQVKRVVGQCAATFEQLGDQRALAYAVYWQSSCSVMTGDRTLAFEYSQRGLDLARANHDHVAEMMLLRAAALALAGIRGREAEAIVFAERALALARQAGEPTHELDAMRMLAHVSNLTGFHQAAERLARTGIDLAAEQHYIADRAYFLGALGDACHGLARYQEAIDVLGRALPEFREHGLRRHEALCLLKMAEAHIALGNTSQAENYLTQCQPVFTDLRLPAYVHRIQKARKKIVRFPERLS